MNIQVGSNGKGAIGPGMHDPKGEDEALLLSADDVFADEVHEFVKHFVVVVLGLVGWCLIFHGASSFLCFLFAMIIAARNSLCQEKNADIYLLTIDTQLSCRF